MDGYAVVAADTVGAARDDAGSLRCDRTDLHRPGADARRDAGRVRRDRHRRPDAGRRRRGGDGRGNGGTATDDVRIFAPRLPGQNIGRQGADIRAGQTVLRARRLLNAEPHRRRSPRSA